MRVYRGIPQSRCLWRVLRKKIRPGGISSVVNTGSEDGIVFRQIIWMRNQEDFMEMCFFEVSTSEYVADTDYLVTRPASINHPKDHAVMFITNEYPEHRDAFLSVSQCLIFWPEEWEVPAEISKQHAVVPSRDPHLAYCKFYVDHGITGLCEPDEFEIVNGAYIAKTAKIGKNTTIFPGVYIGGQVIIGDNCYIGAGVKIVGRVTIGNRVWIRENTVIGSDALTTDRDGDGHPITMPQFGGVVIEDDVIIDACAVVLRGAIDDTVLHRGCKISNLVLVSHNVSIGEESFVIAVTHMFGSSSVGKQAQVSGGCVVGNYVHIGDRALLGMGAVANKDIPENMIAYGNPAKPVRKHYPDPPPRFKGALEHK